MLDWSKIDNYKVFQRLVNHLFALECNSPGFIPSSPYIGADGGWDGYYKGIYPPENIDGTWSVQSKWTKYSGDDGFNALKPRIKGELENSKNKFDHLRIVTNAELTVDHILDLEKLNKGQVSTLKIWAREDLDRRIELQPYLKYRFFGLPQYPKFVPPDFDKDNKNLKLPNLNSDFSNYLEKAKEFVSNDNENVLIVHSPGDYGKTYLLNAIAENAHKIDSKLQSWMVRPGFRIMEDSLQDEIINGRKYLLIFDNADRYLEEIKPLLSFCKHHRDSIKVILACRGAGLKYIYDIIKNEQIEELYNDIKISHWSKDDLIQLLKEITGEDRIEYEEIAVRYPSPSLMIVIGNQIKTKQFDFDKFEEKYVNELLYDAERCLEDFINLPKVNDFLLNIACITPFSDEDNNILEILKKEFKLSEIAIKEIIRNLKEGGVLRDVGGAIRFDPDLKGDLFLGYMLKKLPEVKIKNLINVWLPVCADKVFINLEEAFTHENVNTIKNILSEMIDNWISDAEETDGYSRRQNLNLLKEMCIIVPENCLDILNVYLDSEAPASKDPNVKMWGMENESPSTSDYALTIIKLRNIDGLRRNLTELIEKITFKDIDRPFFGYTSSQIVQKLVEPTENTVNSIIETLNVFEEWLDNPNEVRIKIISSALSEILLGSHHYDRLIQMKVYWTEIPQPRTKKIIEMRKKALKILKKMSILASGKYLKESIEVAEKIGQTTKINEEDLPISDILAKERGELITTIGQLIRDDTDFNVLTEIENLFLNWWAQKKPGSDKVQNYLLKIPNTLKYNSFKYFTSNFVIENFESFFKSFEKEAPAEGRWKWFSNKKYKYLRDIHKPEHYKNFVEKLNANYKVKKQVLELFKDLNELINNSFNWPIISCWVKINPDLFFAIRNDDETWNKVPNIFKREIDTTLSEINENHLEILAEEVLSNLTPASYFEIETFLKSIGRTNFDPEIIDSWLLELLEKGDSKIRWLVVSYLNFIFGNKNDFNSIIKYLTLVITKEKDLSDEMVKQIDLIITLNKNLDSTKIDLLNRFKEELIKKMKDVPDITQTQSILNFIFDDIDSVTEFIDYRLYKYKEIQQSEVRFNYNPIPFDGIECIKKSIKSFEDFEKFMDKIIEWHESPMSWRRQFLVDIKSNLFISEKESGKLFIEKYIENQVKKGKIENVIGALKFLPFTEERIPLIVKISDDIIKSNILNVDEIEKLFYSKSSLDGGYITAVGKVPKELSDKKTLFEKIREETKPGRLRVIINNCIKRIDQEIERHVEWDEESLNPRR